MTSKEIISKLPYAHPFLFVDEISTVSEQGITGHYRFDPKADYYQGHFKNNPVTPGVILTETMAQIGLVAFGVYLTKATTEKLSAFQIAMTSTNIDFFIPVIPPQKITVVSTKEYFRFQKLKCAVEMFNEDKQLVCRGTISGMIKQIDEK